MALPTKANLQTLDFAYLGQPFCHVEAKALLTNSLDIAYQAQPFVTSSIESGVTGSSASINSSDIASGVGTTTVKGSVAAVNSPDAANVSGISGAPADSSLAFITVTNSSASAKTSEPVSFGLPLSALALTALRPYIRVYDDNGSGGRGAVLANFQATLNSTDIDNKTRFVRIDGILPALAGSTTRKLEVVATDVAAPTGTAITAADILATSFQCTVTINIDGTSYSADVRTALAGGSVFSKAGAVVHGTFYSGTCSTAILCSMPPMNGATPHASGDGLRVKFQVYAYKSGTAAVSGGNPITYAHCDVVLENGDVTRVTPSHYYYGLRIERSTSLTDATLIFTDDTDADSNITRYDYPRKLPPDTLTLSAVAVGSRTATLTAGNWDSDVLGAHIHAVSGVGKAYVTTRTGNLTATVYVYQAFDATSYASGAWIQQGVGHNYGQRTKIARVWVGTKPTNIAALGSHASAITPTTKGVMDYAAGTKMVANYAAAFSAVTHSMTRLDGMLSATALRPLTQRKSGYLGDVLTDVGSTGDRDEIAVIPKYHVDGLIKFDANGRRKIFQNALHFSSWQWAGVSRYSGAPTAGSIGVPIRADNGTTYKWNSAFAGTLIAAPAAPFCEWSSDTAHQGDGGYVPYLLTGDLYWLEALQHQTAWTLSIASNDAYMGVGINKTSLGDALYSIAGHPSGNNQERAVAWGLRDLIHTCALTPNASVPMVYNDKTYLQTYLGKHWTSFLNNKNNLSGTTDGFKYNIGPGPRHIGREPARMGPWQNNYLMATLARVTELGLASTDGAAAVSWMYESVVDNWENTGIAKNWLATGYYVAMRNQSNIFNRTWEAAYKESCLAHPNGKYGANSDDTVIVVATAFDRVPDTISLSALNGTAVTVTVSGNPFLNDPAFYVGGWISAAGSGASGVGQIKSVVDGNTCVIDTVTLPTIITQANTAYPLAAAFLSLTPDPLICRIPGPAPLDAIGSSASPSQDSIRQSLYRMSVVAAVDLGIANATTVKSQVEAMPGFPATITSKFFINPRVTGVTGTAAIVSISDVSIASGLAPIRGTVAAVNFGDSPNSTGLAPVAGTSARINAADAGLASGTTTVTGTAAIIHGADSASASSDMGQARRRGFVDYEEDIQAPRKKKAPRRDIFKDIDSSMDSFEQDKASIEAARLKKIEDAKKAAQEKERAAENNERLLKESRQTIHYLEASLRETYDLLGRAVQQVGSTRDEANLHAEKLRGEIQELEDLIVIVSAL